jgi:nucleotide-binding universal stress UspA family protein
LEKILVATDGSENANRAVEEAAKLAKAFGAKVTVIYVGEKITGLQVEGGVDAINRAIEEEGKQILEDAKQQLTSAGVDADTIFKWGHPEREIVDTASEVGADLIVIGSRGRQMSGFKRFLMGSVSREVAEKAECSVYVVK